jgi:hypothetical protein
MTGSKYQKYIVESTTSVARDPLHNFHVWTGAQATLCAQYRQSISK